MSHNIKASLVLIENSYALSFPDGHVRPLDKEGVRDFLLTFDSEEHYHLRTGDVFDANTHKALAYVDLHSHLIISDPSLIKIITTPPVNYNTVSEYAEKHGKQRSILCRHCREGRIPGAIQQEQRWLIPEDAPYPELDKKGRKAHKSR